MTNDTNTLNGALRELGETMAANLTQQGVTSTWDEGLTTLAAKILDITPGPGPTPTPSSILLTADKSILSYADSESATLSATVLDGSSNPLEDITVEFFKGSVSLGTATTNSSGIATKTYASAGVGDVSFTAEVGMISSETYSIQDCLYYDTQTTDKSRYTVTSGSASVTYSSNGVTVKGTANSDTYVKNTALTLPSSYVLEVEVGGMVGSSGNYGGFCADNGLIDFQTSKVNIYQLSPISSKTNWTHTLTVGDIIKLEMNNGSMKIYVNGTLKTTQSFSNTGIYQHRTYNQRSLTLKNLKVKPL